VLISGSNGSLAKDDAMDCTRASSGTTRLNGLAEEHKEEIDGYNEEIEKLLGTRLKPGTYCGVRSLRSTIDLVFCMLFIDWFLRLTNSLFLKIVAIVDTYMSVSNIIHLVNGNGAIHFHLFCLDLRLKWSFHTGVVLIDPQPNYLLFSYIGVCL
jgi:hypothetical protein